MARITGIGGIFLRARDPKTLSAWYAKHLGITLSDYGGATFLWSDEIPATTGSTTWSLFPENSKHFGPGNDRGPQQAMVNYRVDNLDELLTQLAAANVPIDPDRQSADYGHFAWITDPEGNRVELWQPLADSE
jgi:predicted enzyme related to lactoylglutathione lyase